jgi:capsular exopolysaccharide synthesis family protein
MRHARCHETLGVPNVLGLSSLLGGEIQASQIIQQLKTPRLFFVPAGPRPIVNPAELIASERVRSAFRSWRESFNFVILDTPPALLVNDAVMLAQEVDGVGLVVKGDETPRELVRRVRDRMVRAGAKVLGVVLNNVGPTWEGAYNYDGDLGAASEPNQEQSA